VSKQLYIYITVLPEDDSAGLKHVEGSNTYSAYNSTHGAFSWWFIASVVFVLMLFLKMVYAYASHHINLITSNYFCIAAFLVSQFSSKLLR
jgi:hypothetical protein